MNNIYDYVIERADVTKILEHYKIDYNSKNGTSWCCCPFHHEKTPSFSFNEEIKTYKCWGCKVKGNVISFVKEYELLENDEEIEYYDAMKIVAKICNIKINLSAKDKTEMQMQMVDEVDDLIETEIAEPQQQETFLETALNKFYRKTNTYMTDKGYSKEILDYLEMGFYTGDKNNPMNNRCVFPVRNYKGQLVGWTGRTILNNVQPKWFHAPPKRFLKSLNLYNIDKALPHIYKSGKVNVVESVGNTIRMLEAGKYNTVATLGSTISKEQCDMLVSYGVDIVFWYDWDKGGFEGIDLATNYIEDYDILYVAKTDYGINESTGKSKDIGDVDVNTVNSTIIMNIYEYINYKKERYIQDMENNDTNSKIKLTDGTIVLCTQTVNPKLDIRQLVPKDMEYFKLLDSLFGTNELSGYESQ